jgi:hypothetical protein
MKKNTYTLPNAVNTIFKKVTVASTKGNATFEKIHPERFLSYCLAVYLFSWLKYHELFPSLIKAPPGLKDENTKNLDSLSNKNWLFESSVGSLTNLAGMICLELNDLHVDGHYFIEQDHVPGIELLVNDFFRYQCLKNICEKDPDAKAEYDAVVARFEPLREKYRIPLRLKYNSRTQRDKTEPAKGITVKIKQSAPAVTESVES